MSRRDVIKQALATPTGQKLRKVAEAYGVSHSVLSTLLVCYMQLPPNPKEVLEQLVDYLLEEQNSVRGSLLFSLLSSWESLHNIQYGTISLSIKVQDSKPVRAIWTTEEGTELLHEHSPPLLLEKILSA